MDFASIAQVAAAAGTLVLAILTFFMVKELRETRIAQERPQVIVDADYSDRNVVNVVVRNIGRGAAKEITFDFSAPMESSLSADKSSDTPPINELPYFKEGIDFLAPGAEISCLWDSYVGLFTVLEAKGLREGITIISRYKSIAGEPYETKWKINPLLQLGKPYVGRRDMNDLVRVLERYSKQFERVTRRGRELRVAVRDELTLTEEPEEAPKPAEEGEPREGGV